MEIIIVPLGFLAFIAIAVIWNGKAYVTGRAASSPDEAEANVRAKCARYGIESSATPSEDD